MTPDTVKSLLYIFHQFPALFHISLHFFYVNTFNCVGFGATSGDEVIVVVLLVMVVEVVVVVAVVVVVEY